MVIVIADIVDSRRIPKRKEFMTVLTDALGWVNEVYQEVIVGRFSLTKGIDEFSGALRSPELLPEICAGIQVRLGGVGVRFAAVRGEVDIFEEGTEASRFDGPAFHHAAALMEQLERKGKRFGYRNLSLDGDHPTSLILSNLMTFCLKGIQHWPEKTALIARSAWDEERIGQAKLATNLGITQQSVSAGLKRAEFDLLKSSIRSVGVWFECDDRR